MYISHILTMGYENNTEIFEGLEEKLGNMNILDFCNFLVDHNDSTGMMRRLQKFFDVGINHLCDYHKNHTEINGMNKRLEEKYLNTSLYDFYNSQLASKKQYQIELFELQTELYVRIVTSAIAIITNVLVVTVLSVSWKSWKYSIGILLLILACIDVIGNGICLIYSIPLALKPVSHDVSFPAVFYYLYSGFKRLSYLMMIPISANRYALTCRPLTHNVITSQKSTLIQITTLTLFVATTEIYQFFHMTWFTYHVCFFIFYGITSIVFPLIVSFVLTILVIREFGKRNRTFKSCVGCGAASRLGERNVSRAMIAVNVAFVVLILPTLVASIFMLSFFECNNICHVAVVWITLITDVNYFVNIFIYTLYLPKFRYALFGLFKCRCYKKKRNEPIEMLPI